MVIEHHESRNTSWRDTPNPEMKMTGCVSPLCSSNGCPLFKMTYCEPLLFVVKKLGAKHQSRCTELQFSYLVLFPWAPTPYVWIYRLIVRNEVHTSSCIRLACKFSGSLLTGFLINLNLLQLSQHVFLDFYLVVLLEMAGSALIMKRCDVLYFFKNLHTCYFNYMRDFIVVREECCNLYTPAIPNCRSSFLFRDVPNHWSYF